MTGGRLEIAAGQGVEPVLAYFRAQGLDETRLGLMNRILTDRPGVAPQSLAVYARNVSLVLKELGATPAEAEARDVRRAVQLFIARGSARNPIGVLRSVLEAAGRADLVALTKKVKVKEKRKLQDPDILVIEDVSLLLRDAPTRRDKGLISVLWESGRRIHEVLALNVADVRAVKNGGEDYYRATFRKTKVRGEEGDCLLVESAPYVKAWLAKHPTGGRRDAPLFLDMVGGSMGRFSYSGVYAMLRRIAKIAGITKPVRPHAFRHARITHLLRAGLTDTQVKKAVGLSASSQELARYGHLVQRDVDNAILAMHGKAPLEAVKIGGLERPESLDLIPAMPHEPTQADVDLRNLVEEFGLSGVREILSTLERLRDAKGVRNKL